MTVTSRTARKTHRIAAFTGQIFTDLIPPVTIPVRRVLTLEAQSLTTVGLLGDLQIEGNSLLHRLQGALNHLIYGDTVTETVLAETCELNRLRIYFRLYSLVGKKPSSPRQALSWKS